MGFSLKRRPFASIAVFLAAVSLTTCRLDDLLKPGEIGALAGTPTEYVDSAFAGSTATKSFEVALTVEGTGERLRFSSTTQLGSGWLQLSAASGVAPGTFGVTVDPAGLPAGEHVDTIVFTAEGPEARDLRVPVRLKLLPCAVGDLPALPTSTQGQLATTDCASPRFPDRFAKRFRFAGTANDSVTFNLSATAFAPSLAVFPAGSATPLVERSSCAVAANAACARYVRLPGTGDYVVEATSTSARATGAFDLVIGRPRAPGAPTSLNQLANAAPNAPVPVGSTISATAIRLQAALTDPDLDSLRLEVEVRPVTAAFTGTPSASSALGVGTLAVAVTGLGDASGYKWRARAVDVTGRASAWVEFGGNPADANDFAIAIPDAPQAPTALFQRKTDGTTVIPLLGTTDESSIQLGATVNDPDAGDQLRLEVEVRPMGTALSNTATHTSVPVAPGGTAFVTVTGLVDDADYRWQARTVDQTGRASAWTRFSPSGTTFSVALPPSRLAMTAAPSAVGAGAAITPAVRVEAQDANGAILTSFTGPVTVALGDNPAAATLGGTLTVNAVAGIATFGDLTLDRSGTGFTLVAAAGTLSVTSPPFDVTSATAQSLEIAATPAGAVAGATIAPAVEVRVRDAFGNLATGYAGAVTLAVATNAAGAVLAGTTTVNAVAGVATFADVRIARAADGLVLVASASGLADANSQAFRVLPAAPAALRLATTPSSTAQSGVAFARQPVVVVEDAFGNRVPSGGVTVQATIATGAAAALANAQAATDATGAATFGGLALTGPSGAYTLRFAATGLTAVTSGTITLGAGGPARLALEVPPSATVASGASLAVGPRIQVQDAAENPVAQAGIPVTVAIASGEGVLSGTLTALTDANGEAEFTDLVITGVTGVRTFTFTSPGLIGVVSGSLTVTAGAPAAMALDAGDGQVATAGSAVAIAPSVVVRDASDNPVPGVAVAFVVTAGGGSVVPPGTVLTDADGRATLTSWTLGTVLGVNTLEARVDGLAGSPVTFTATGVAGAAATLAITGGDNLAGPVGTELATPHEVRVTDANGNPVAGVTVNWQALGGGSVAPAVSVTDADGRATTVRTLGPTAGAQSTTATAVLAGGPATVTFALTANVGGATQMSLVSGDGQADTVGATLPVPLRVLVRDALNNPVPGVLISWTVIDGGGSVSPATSLTDAAGIATAQWTLGTVTTPTDSTQLARASGVGTPVNFVATSRPGAVSATQTLVSVAPATVAASRTTPATVTVTARDRFGNAIPNRAVTLAASGVGNTILQPAAPTNATGVTTGAIGAIVAGARTIVATVDGVVAAQQPTLTVVAAPASALTFVSLPTAATAGSSIVPAPEVGAVDSLGNRTITFTGAVTVGIATNPAGGTLSGTLTRNAVAGVATFPGLSLDRAGTGYRLLATSTGLAAATSAALDVTAGAVSPARSLLSIAPATLVAGQDTATITVTARDASDNPIAGATVVLAAAGTGGTLVQPVAVTDANGVATGRFTATGVGTRTIGATVAGVDIDATADVAVVAGAVSATTSTIGALPLSIVAGAGTSTITVVARDALGNVVPGATVVLAATGTGNTLVQPAATTDANGVATGTLASTTAQAKTVTATVGGVALAGSATVNVTAAAVSGTASTIALAPASITAGGAASTVTVSARDAFGNPVAGAAVVLSVSGTGNTVTQPVGTTNALGVATGSVASTVAGDKLVGATVNGVAVVTQPTLTVTPGSVSGTLSTFALSSGTLVAGAATVTVTVTARDALGNPVAGAPVVVTVTGSGNAVTQPPATDAAGIAVGAIGATVAGARTVSVTVGGVTLTQVEPLTVLPGAVSPALSSLVAAPDAVTTDGTSSTVTVTARDANGNAIPGLAVVLAATGDGNTLTQPAAVTDANGVASGALASSVAGLKVLTATIGGVAIDQADTVTVTAGAVSAAQSTVVVAPDTVVAGGAAATVTVTARDASGNPVAGQAVVLSATGAGNTLTQPVAVTDANGVATGTLGSTATGAKVVSASIGGLTIADTDTLVVRPAAVSATLSTLSTSSGTISAATGSATITVTARDAFGNAIPGLTVVLAATGDGNTITQPASATDANGVTTGTMSSTVSEAKTVSATVDGVALAQTVVVTVVPDLVSGATTTIAVTPDSISADGQAATITVTARDANGNLVPGVTVALAVTGSGTLTQPAATTDANGVATGAFTSGTVGVRVVTATVNGVAVADTDTVTVVPGAVSAGTSTVAAAPGAISADGGTSTITITARDANGNVVPGRAVTIAVSGTGNVVGQPAAPTDANGVATATLASSTAGVRTVTATIDGVTVTATATVTVTAGAVSATLTTLDAAPDTITTDAAASTVTVTARDQFGNAVPGATVVLAAAGSGTAVTQPAATNAAGVATGAVTATLVGPKIVSATVNGVAIVAADTITVVPGAVSAATSSIAADQDQLVAGATTTEITVTARDANGNPVPGRTVVLAATGTGNTLTQPLTVTDASGVATGSLLSTRAGTKVLSATIDGLAVTQRDTLAVVAAAASADSSLIALSPAIITAGGAASTVTVTARDAFGNPVEGVTVTIAATGAGNTVTQPSALTDAGGEAVGSIASTATGTKTVTATVDGVAVTQGATLTVNPGAVSAAQSTVVAAPASITTDGQASTITVTARDAQGNPVAGLAVALSATGGGNTLTQPAAVTDANGVATGTLTSTAAGSKVVSATIGGTAVTQTATVTVTAGAVSAGTSTLAASPSVIAAVDGTSTITVTARDANSNPIAGATVTFSATGTGNTLTPSAVTDANGVATGTLSSSAAGAKVVSATVAGTAITQTDTVTVTAGTVSASQSTVVSAPGTITAGGSGSTITVTARDASGNPVPGATVVLAATGTGNSITQPAVTDANGVATGTIASTVAEPKTVTATIDGTPVTQTTSVVVGPAAVSGATSSLAASPASITAGGSGAAITVTARDEFGNVVSGATVVLAATPSDGNTLTQPAAVTDANGVAGGSIASTVAGVKTVSATIDGVAVAQTVDVTVTAGAVSAARSGLVAAPTTLSADGGSSAITVTARDANGNPIAGATVVLAATGTGNTLTQPAAVTDANGVATASLSSTGAGTKTISATVAGTAIDSTATVTVNAGAVSAAQSSVVAAPGGITAGGAGSTITVTARDQFGNPVPGATVSLAADPATNLTLTQPAAVTDASGVATGTVAATLAGVKTITATIGTTVVSQAASVTVAPAAVDATQSTLAVSDATIAAGSGSTTITVTARDQFGNAVPGMAVVLAATGTGNTLVQPAAVTDVNGQATGSLSSSVSESKTVSATAGGVALAQTAAVNVVPDVASGAQSTLTLSTDTIVAGGAGATVTVTARDASGNPASGVTVVVSVTGTGNTVTGPAATTDANGVATALVTSVTAGTKSVSATVNGVAVQQTATLTVTPGTVSATATTVSASPASITAGGTASTITVTARDANNNPIPGLAVSLAATGTGNTLTQPAAVTDANGVATGTLASTVAEAKGVTATVDGVAITQSPTVTVTPAAVSATASTVEAAPTTLTAGSGSSTITVTARDQFGNVITNQPVVLAATGTGNTLTQPAANTNAAGVATGSLSSTGAGTKTISATIAGTAITATATVTVSAATVSASTSTVTAAPASIVAGTGTSTITVTARDAFSNPVAGVAVVLAATGTGNTLTQPAAVTDANGVATGTLSSTTAGAKTVTATAGGVAITQAPAVTVTAGPLSATGSTVQAAPSSIVAVSGVSAITVTARDQFGNALGGGLNVVISVSPATGNTLTLENGITNGSGQEGATLSSTVAGDKVVSATIEGLAIVQTDTVTVTPGPVSAATSTVAVSPASITTDGQQGTITVTVRDANGNVVPGASVVLTSDPSANVTLTQPTAVTDANGVATGTIASTVAGTKTVSATASVGGTPTAITQTATVTVTAGAVSAANTTVSASPASITAGGAGSTITVTARDANNNLVPNATVVLAVSGSGNALAQPAAPTNASGVATGSFSSTVTGDKVVSATVGGVAITQTDTVTVTPGAVSATASTVEVAPASVVAGGSATVTVTARDANGNAIPNASVVVAASGSGNTLTPASGNADASGVFTATLSSTTTGVKDVTATVAGVPLSTAATLTVTAGAVSAAQSTVTTSSATLGADGGAATITVTARDTNGNPVAGRGVTVSSTGDGNTITPASGTTDAGGIFTATFSSTRAEPKTISAVIDGSVSVTQTAAITVNPGALSTTVSTLVAAPDALTAGSGSSTITVTARDQHGNAIPSLAVVLSVTGGTGNTLTQPSASTDVNGVATGSLASIGAGVKIVSATIGGTAITQADTVTVSAAAVDAARILVSASPASVSADGGASTITVTARDQYDNPVPDATVVLAAEPTPGNTLTQPAATTDANGQATGSLSSTAVGAKVVTATVDGVPATQTATVTVTAGAISAITSTISASPTTLTAGSGTSTITVTARDANNNPVPGLSVVLAATGTGNVITQPSAVTDSNGVATGTFASTAAESKTISATVGGQLIDATAAITVGVGAVSAAQSSVDAEPESIVAGGTGSTVTVTARDASNNPIAGATVSLTVIGDGVTVTQPVGTTAANGTITGSFTATSAGAKVVVATIGGTEVTQRDTVTVTPAAVSAAQSTVTVSAASIDADAGTATVTVTARDEFGNPVPGATVSLAATGTGNGFTPADTGTTDANGVLTATFSSTRAEAKTLTATVETVVLNQQPTVTVTPGAVSATASTVAVASGTITAGDAGTTVTVTALDQHGNAIANALVTPSATGSGNTFTPASGGTNAGGVFTTTYTSSVAGAKTVSASVAGVELTQTQAVSVIAGSVSADSTSVAASPATITAGGTGSTVTVTVRDANGNPVAGASVSLAVSGSGNTVTQPTGTTDAAGTIAGSFTSNVAEEKVVTATVNGNIVATRTDTVTVTPAAASQLVVTTQPTDIQAGALVSPAVEVEARDAFGNRATSFTGVVTVAIDAGSGTENANLLGTLTAAASAGVATFSTLSIDSAGTGYRLQATSTGLAAAVSSAFDVTPGAATAGTSLITPADGVATAGETEVITVQLRDQFGNLVTSSGGTVALSTTLGTLSTVTDNLNGTYTATLTTSSAGTATITGTLDGNAITDDATVTVTPAAAAQLVVTAQPSSIVAGSPISPAVEVEARDAFGNRATSFAGAVTVAIDPGSGTENATLLGTLTAAASAGVATFSTLSIDSVGGGYRLRATADGLTAAVSAPFDVTAGAAVVGTTQITAAPASITVDGSSTVTVRLRDQFGNAVTSPGGTVTLATTLGSLTTVTDNNDGTYTATLTATTPGTATITGQLNGNTITDDASVTVGVGAASAATTQITAAPTVITTDESATITVRLLDQYGNAVATSGGTVTLATTHGTLSAVADDNDGTYTATLTATTLGTATITGELNGNAIADNATVTVNAGAVSAGLSTVAAAPGAITAGGTGSTITVTARDANNNPIAGATVILAATGAGNTLTDTTGTTNVSGVFTATLTSTGAGDKAVSATIAGTAITQTATVTVTPATASQLAVTTQPSNTTAGTPITPAVVIEARDAFGNRATGFAGDISMAIDPGSGTPGAILLGTTTATASAGVAAFSTLSVDRAGVGYALRAGSSGVTDAVSTSFIVTPGLANAAASLISAADGAATAGETELITVQLRDQYGNALTGSGGTVVLSTTLGSLGTVTDNLNGTYSATLTTDTAGTATITGTLDGIAIGDNATVTITAAAASQLVVTTQPSDIVAGTDISPAVVIEARDAFGNLVTSFTGTVTMAIDVGSGTTGANLLGALSADATAGVATFGALTIDSAGTGYRLRASAGGLTDAVTNTFAVTPGAASALTTLITAADGVATTAETEVIIVQLRDQFGNNLTTSTATVALSTTLGTLSEVVNNGNGTYSATLTPDTAGTATITGTLDTTPIADNATVVVTTASFSAGDSWSAYATTPATLSPSSGYTPMPPVTAPRRGRTLLASLPGEWIRPGAPIRPATR